MHHVVDGKGRPPVALIGPGQAGDAPMFPHLMRHLRVARAGRGRGITAAIPAPAGQRRSLTTRYDKLAIADRSAVVLHAAITWTKALSDPT